MPAVRIALAPLRLLRRLPGPVRIAASPVGPFLFFLFLWIGRALFSLSATDATTVLLPASDTDALRLVHVQALVTGEAHGHVIHRVAPPQGFRPAFSALVDRTQAALLAALASHLPDHERAAQLFLLLWPQALALLAGLGLVALGLALGGVAAGHVAAVMAPLMPAGMFAAGRLDDAGVQLVILLPALALLSRGWMRTSALAAGLGGLLLAMAVTLSPFGLLAVVVSVILLAAILHLRIGRITRSMVAGLGIGLLAGGMIGHVAETMARHAALSAVTCDATGVNWAAAMVMAGLALALAGLLPQRWQTARRQRLWLLAPLLSLSPIAFAALAPACLTVPAGLADPQALHVLAREIGPVPSLVEQAADSAFWLPVAWALAAMLAAFTLLRLRHVEQAATDSSPHARRAAFLQGLGWRQALALMAVVTLALAVTALWDARRSPAVLWPVAGLLAAGLAHALPRHCPAFMAAPAIILPAVLMAPLSLHAAVHSTPPLSLADLEATMRKAWLMPMRADGAARTRLACLKAALNVAAGEDEPAGLVLAPARLGAYILLASRQPVLAVADPRAGQALELNARALTDEPSLARARLLTLGAALIVHTDGIDMPRPGNRSERTPGLWQNLSEGALPDWLDPVTATHDRHEEAGNGACGLKVYRVKANLPLPPIIKVPAFLLEGIAPEKTAGPVR